MGIAVGFACTDGVVLGADSELTTGWDKYRGPKVWKGAASHMEVAITGAGHYLLMRRAAEAITDRLSIVTESLTIDELRQSIIEPALADLYDNHIDQAPVHYVNSGFDLSLLVGVRGTDGMGLYETSRTIVSAIPSFACIGAGAPLARYIADALYHSGANAWWACSLAAYLLHQVKRYARACGGDTTIFWMTDDGPGDIISQELAPMFESVGRHLYGAVHEVFRECSWPMDQTDADKAIKVFQAAVERCVRGED